MLQTLRQVSDLKEVLEAKEIAIRGSFETLCQVNLLKLFIEGKYIN